MTFIAPLDLETIFLTVFAGSSQIFIFLALILIACLAGFFRMNNTIALTMGGLFIVIMSAYYRDLYFLTILIAGVGIFYGIGRLVKS